MKIFYKNSFLEIAPENVSRYELFNNCSLRPIMFINKHFTYIDNCDFYYMLRKLHNKKVCFTNIIRYKEYILT